MKLFSRKSFLLDFLQNVFLLFSSSGVVIVHYVYFLHGLAPFNQKSNLQKVLVSAPVVWHSFKISYAISNCTAPLAAAQEAY